ncbi:hypothetical protein [Streptomyces tirandamycinicus]|uniref:Uncharacterized protein n=1 Tax=Streptomyces tirandamycinicus TaxID=2174846 RepID=A0A2S1T1U4_9ACTN|nr:hypothetical protein [Streptomyces tirandamycinicus]AWI32620.1 hypothetical protein DDW44_30335 [Streptomyces tirandamycinicus]
MSSTDYAKLRAAAKAEVNAELAEVKDPFERRTVAEEIRDQAHMELASRRSEWQQLIAAAALYEYAPQLHERFGITRTHLKRLAMSELLGGLEDPVSPPSWPADRAKAAADAGIPHPKNVVDQAAAVAERYEYAEARRGAALAHLEAAHEAVRTAGGRVAVEALERPDFDAIREQARKEIVEEFAKLAVSPEERLRRAAEAVDQAEEEAATLLPERDAAVCSLAFYTTARGVYYSAGINRNSLKRVLTRALGLPRDSEPPKRADQPAAARAAGVPFLEDAASTLPDIAKEYEAAQARRSAAIEIRDAAIRVMHAAPYSWSRTQIAEAIDRDPKVVARVVAPAENT